MNNKRKYYYSYGGIYQVQHTSDESGQDAFVQQVSAGGHPGQEKYQLQDDAYQCQGKKESNKIIPVRSRKERKRSSRQVITDSSERNSDDKYQKRKETFNSSLEKPTDKTDD